MDSKSIIERELLRIVDKRRNYRGDTYLDEVVILCKELCAKVSIDVVAGMLSRYQVNFLFIPERKEPVKPKPRVQQLELF